MKSMMEKYGPPNIDIEGLRIWVHARANPDSYDFGDGNWLNITAHCVAKSADVCVSGTIIMVPEIINWMTSSKSFIKMGLERRTSKR